MRLACLLFCASLACGGRVVPVADPPDAGCVGAACPPAPTCDPACPSWETCSGTTCVLPPGSCTTSSDCPDTLPICDPSHTCTAPAVTPPWTPSFTAALITNAAYAGAFAPLAQLHTLTGVPTQLITVEAICAVAPGGCSATDACHDAAKAIKDWLIAQHARGLRQVVLGGDAHVAPSRRTRAVYSNSIYGVDFDETFLSDYYFADLSEWDTNHDCVYGEPGSDSPGYLPTLGVTRVSASSLAEVQAYTAKARAYLTTAPAARALFLSNVADSVTIPGIEVDVPIDAALYFQYPGRTLSLMPPSFEVTRLYSSLGAWPGAQPLTISSERTAFERGQSLAIHSGHGAEEDLTVEQDGSNEFTGAMAHALQNAQTPILLSCACDAATFADGDACAGQQFITAPAGGGVGYLGNSATGLGIAGGMQLIDAMLRYSFAHSNPLAGEAVLAGHLNLPTSDTITIPNVPLVGSVALSVIDANSWRWTQKAATYLGDGLLPLYTDFTRQAAPAFTVRREPIGAFSRLTFTPSRGVAGTLAVSAGAQLYQLAVAASGDPGSITVAGPVTTVALGFSSPGTLAGYTEVVLP